MKLAGTFKVHFRTKNHQNSIPLYRVIFLYFICNAIFIKNVDFYGIFVIFVKNSYNQNHHLEFCQIRSIRNSDFYYNKKSLFYIKY